MGKTIGIRLSKDMEKALRHYAEEHGTTVSAAVKTALRLLFYFEEEVDLILNRTGKYFYLFFPEKSRGRKELKSIMRFTERFRLPENISEEELKEYREALGDKTLKPGQIVESTLASRIISPEDALSEVAFFLGEPFSASFSVEEFEKRYYDLVTEGYLEEEELKELIERIRQRKKKKENHGKSD